MPGNEATCRSGHELETGKAKRWTVGRKKVPGSSPTCSSDLSLFWVHSAPPKYKLSFAFLRVNIKVTCKL